MSLTAVLKWLLNRPVYLKKELLSLYHHLIYQKQSHFLPHNWNAHRCPYEAIMFYNFMGRVGFASKELFALLSGGKVFAKSIQLDGYDATTPTLLTKGIDQQLWPTSPLIDTRASQVDDAFFEKIEKALHLSERRYHDSLDKTKDWEVVREKFHQLLFDKEGHFNKEALINFRKDHAFEEIIGDAFKQVDVHEGYMAAYLKGIDLVLEFHRSASVVKKEILASISESYAGESTCVHYRGQRLSEKLLFYAVSVDDILKNISFNPDKRQVIMDVGTGYGALPAILHNYVPNACYIVTDLPEVVSYAAYYLRYNFPDKKIALLDDVEEGFSNFDALVEAYDFIVLPSKAIEEIPKGSVDLFVNTASLGFLSQEYLDFYLHHIYRVLKAGGYFYSINKTHTCKWGIGMYEWELDQRYLTLSLAFNNRFAYPQWLGQKIERGVKGE